MTDIPKIISELVNFSNNFFTESQLYFTKVKIIPNTFYHYYSTGNITSKAINCHSNDRIEINVIKWFDDFWFYLELKFIKLLEENDFKPFFSLSVFEGSFTDNIKNQIFRAEWDSFYDNNYHPQPHWHFYSNSVLDNLVNNFSSILNEDQSDFLSLISEEKSPKININKMHFAMGAQWSNSIDGHISAIHSEEEFINWYKGLLTHIRYQLAYAK
jgi:hypothetical protein